MPGPESSIRVSMRIEAEVHRLFALVSQHENAVRVIEGLETLTPVGGRTRGVGSRFEAVMRLGPKTVRSEIEIAEIRPDRLVRWESPAEARSLTFEFRSVGEATAVRLTVTYERPAGVGGLLAGPLVEETIRGRARRTLQRMKELAGQPG